MKKGMELQSIKVKDMCGNEHTYTVHPVQKPLPPFYDNTSHDLVHFLQASDYAVETDPEVVKELLDLNMEEANKGFSEGWDLHALLSLHHPIKDELGALFLLNSSGIPLQYQTLHGAGIAYTIGNRAEMEDAELVAQIALPSLSRRKILCLGIFDGHGGSRCSTFASANFTLMFQKWLDDPLLVKQEKNLRIYNAIHLTFAELNRSFQEVSGTTANIALLIDKELWVVNLGDSRSLFVAPKKALQLSEDQKPNLEKYAAIVKERGGAVLDDGEVFRIYQPLQKGIVESLSPGGSLGDHTILGAMNPHPSIIKFPLPARMVGCYYVASCDGVYEKLSSKMVAQIVELGRKAGLSPAGIAVNIVQNAYNAGSNDNISVIVSPLKYKP